MDFGVLLAAVAWPVLLLAGWLMAILLVGLMVARMALDVGHHQRRRNR